MIANTKAIALLLCSLVVSTIAGDSFEANTVAWIEGLNGKTAADMDYHRQYFRDDAELNWHFAPDHMKATNVEEVSEMHVDWWTKMPDMKIRVNEIISAGDKVAVQITAASKEKDVSFERGGIFTGVAGKLQVGNWYGDFTWTMEKLGVYEGNCKKE